MQLIVPFQNGMRRLLLDLEKPRMRDNTCAGRWTCPQSHVASLVVGFCFANRAEGAKRLQVVSNITDLRTICPNILSNIAGLPDRRASQYRLCWRHSAIQQALESTAGSILRGARQE